MNHPRPRFFAPAFLAALLLWAVPVLALDTPALESVRQSRTSLTMDVTAGESGAPAGFTLEWMKASDFDLLGGFPADETSPVVRRASFVGTPTLNTTDGTTTFLLDALASAHVELGDLFDETGVVDPMREELLNGTEYVVRVYAGDPGSGQRSAPSAPLRVSTMTTSIQNCTYTQGFWKNHGSGACQSGNNADVWPVGSLLLGTVNYSAAQLCAIFNQPAAGNGLISLAHQLITAKLNIAQGAVAPAGVLAAIASADAMIGALVVPPIGAGSLAPGATSSLTNTLDQFNNGVTGPGHCGSTNATPSTWGTLKLRYR